MKLNVRARDTRSRKMDPWRKLRKHWAWPGEIHKDTTHRRRGINTPRRPPRGLQCRSHQHGSPASANNFCSSNPSSTVPEATDITPRIPRPAARHTKGPRQTMVRRESATRAFASIDKESVNHLDSTDEHWRGTDTLDTSSHGDVFGPTTLQDAITMLTCEFIGIQSSRLRN